VQQWVKVEDVICEGSCQRDTPQQLHDEILKKDDSSSHRPEAQAFNGSKQIQSLNFFHR
jgi:hypothetical protein